MQNPAPNSEKKADSKIKPPLANQPEPDQDPGPPPDYENFLHNKESKTSADDEPTPRP